MRRKIYWTFDNNNPTSGFHILYAYLIFLFNKLFGCSNHGVYPIFVISLFSSILLALSCYLTCNLIRKKIGLKFAIFGSVRFFSKDLILKSTVGMESGLVIFASSLIFYLLAKRI